MLYLRKCFSNFRFLHRTMICLYTCVIQSFNCRIEPHRNWHIILEKSLSISLLLPFTVFHQKAPRPSKIAKDNHRKWIENMIYISLLSEVGLFNLYLYGVSHNGQRQTTNSITD